MVTDDDGVVTQQVAQLRLSRDKLLAELEKPACCTGSHSARCSVTCPEVMVTDDDGVITQQVAQLRLSRDKLLAEPEKQSLEVDQLACCTASHSAWYLITCPEVITTDNDNVRNLQIAQLRVSRDKLLAELEKQFLEVDQLASENAALSQVCTTGLTSHAGVRECRFLPGNRHWPHLS